MDTGNRMMARTLAFLLLLASPAFSGEVEAAHRARHLKPRGEPIMPGATLSTETQAMKPAILIVFSTLTLIAQEAIPTADPWDLVIQGGALAILGFAVVWGLTRTIPAMNKSHEEERGQFWERMDRWEAGLRDDSKRLNDTLDRMTNQCHDAISRADNKKD